MPLHSSLNGEETSLVLLISCCSAQPLPGTCAGPKGMPAPRAGAPRGAPGLGCFGSPTASIPCSSSCWAGQVALQVTNLVSCRNLQNVFFLMKHPAGNMLPLNCSSSCPEPCHGLQMPAGGGAEMPTPLSPEQEHGQNAANSPAPCPPPCPGS